MKFLPLRWKYQLNMYEKFIATIAVSKERRFLLFICMLMLATSETTTKARKFIRKIQTKNPEYADRDPCLTTIMFKE